MRHRNAPKCLPVNLAWCSTIDHIGQYLEIDPLHRPAFTWAIRGIEGETSRVIIDISPTADGCELTLTREMDREWSEFVGSAEDFWTLMLDARDIAVTGQPV